MLVANLATLPNVALKNTLTSTFAIYSHHSFVTLFTVQQLCNHDAILFGGVI